MTMNKEVFLPVKGYENRFKISNYGTLISFNRVGRGRVLPDEVEMECSIDRAGYKTTTLRMIGKKRWCVRIHTLVAMHFVENNKPSIYDTVNHIDGNKQNNHYKNLEWCTRGENMAHAFRIGLVDKKGEKSHNAKLRSTDILKIRALYQEGYLQREISAIFNIGRRHVSDIVNRVCWAHI